MLQNHAVEQRACVRLAARPFRPNPTADNNICGSGTLDLLLNHLDERRKPRCPRPTGSTARPAAPAGKHRSELCSTVVSRPDHPTAPNPWSAQRSVLLLSSFAGRASQILRQNSDPAARSGLGRKSNHGKLSPLVGRGDVSAPRYRRMLLFCHGGKTLQHFVRERKRGGHWQGAAEHVRLSASRAASQFRRRLDP